MKASQAKRCRWNLWHRPLLKDPRMGGGGGLLSGALASPGRPTHPPTSENFSSVKKIKSIKGAGSLKADFRDTNFCSASDLRGGGGPSHSAMACSQELLGCMTSEQCAEGMTMQIGAAARFNRAGGGRGGWVPQRLRNMNDWYLKGGGGGLER